MHLHILRCSGSPDDSGSSQPSFLWWSPRSGLRSCRRRTSLRKCLPSRIQETCSHCKNKIQVVIIRWQWCGYCSGLLSCAYNVPTTRFVLNWFWSPPNILAIPKSDILGFISASRRMLLALRSRWTTRSLESRWRYSSPLAMPSIISNRLLQSRSPCFSGSVHPQSSQFNQHICCSDGHLRYMESGGNTYWTGMHLDFC